MLIVYTIKQGRITLRGSVKNTVKYVKGWFLSKKRGY